MHNMLAVAGVVVRSWSRRKEGYILILLLAAMLYAIGGMHVFGTGGSALYLFDVGLLLTWLAGWIVALHAGATELPGEELRGTIFLLLAKPLSRTELLIGKWLGAWVSATACTLGCYAVALAAAVISGVHPSIALAQACLLHLVSLAVLTALALAVSTRLNRDATVSISIVAGLALYLVVPGIPQLAAQADGWRTGALDTLYYVLPHLELFDLRRRVLHGYGPIPGGVLLTLIAYGAVWTSILLTLGWLAYRNRTFQRDKLLD